ncbi:SGNH/GDSL hydrolase family protein [Brevundimonas vitis]|nr:SGNH/GDSL hydrolase family protein [Brevundimonas vitisensis]
MRQMTRTFVMIAALLLGGGTAHAQDAASRALPVHVGGRVIVDPDGGLTFGWPGIYFEARFSGTAVRVRFEAPTEHMRLLIDGQERAAFRRPGLVDLTLDGLAPGDHVVRLEKQTESQTGGGRFIAFEAVGDTVALTFMPRPRQIEFIGDSYTVGYGNTSGRRECSAAEVHAFTDTQQAFGPRVARHFDADYRTHAYSGFGIVRNYAGTSPDLSLPTLYGRMKPDDAERMVEGPGDWRPQVIVINLGTNDFSTPVGAGERWADEAGLRAEYRQRYIGFVRDLAREQPQARFILMGSDAFFGDVQAVAAAVNADQPDRAVPLAFGGLELGGCDWHPSIDDDARIAELIQATIETMGVWSNELTAP